MKLSHLELYELKELAKYGKYNYYNRKGEEDVVIATTDEVLEEVVNRLEDFERQLDHIKDRLDEAEY